MRIRTELSLDEELLRLAEERAAATGRDRHEVIEEAFAASCRSTSSVS